MAIDAHLTLAMAMRSIPKSYALLLGAGISVASGVPSAWEVQERLIRQLAAMRSGDPAPDPFAWYAKEYGQESTYDGLLGALTHSRTERQAALSQFFTFPTDEADPDRGRPTIGHQSIARLVTNGLVRIIVTTNFDTVLETAVRAAGTEPVIVTEPADIAGLAPLHTINCLIVHVHGDYLHASGMLNTADELAKYPPELDELLDEIWRDYGLVCAGWSAQWDIALRRSITRCARRIWTPYWVEPYALSEAARDLITARGAHLVTRDAETFFAQLADACDALADSDRPSAATLQSVVGAAKRALSGRAVAIPVHDTLRRELEGLATHFAVTGTVASSPGEADPCSGFGPFAATDGPSEFQRRLTALTAAMQTPAALVATVAYWGDGQTTAWWLPDVHRLARPRSHSGATDAIGLASAPALVLLYAAGVAATAANKWDLVVELLTTPVTDDEKGQPQPLLRELEGRDVLAVEAPHTWLYDFLQPLLAETVGLGTMAYEDAFQNFEYLAALQGAYFKLAERNFLERALIDRRSLDEKQRRAAVLEQEPPTTDHVIHASGLEELRRDVERRGEHRASLARPQRLPHVWMRLHRGAAFPRLRAAPAAGLGEQLRDTTTPHALVSLGLIGGNTAYVQVVKDALDTSLHEAADQARTLLLMRHEASSEF